MQSSIRKGLAAIDEGIETDTRYRALANISDEELSALGLDRSDALRVGEVGARDIPGMLRLAAVVVRAVFLCVLVAIIVHVSHPQSETIWTAHETPVDAMRLVLGIAASILIVPHIFIMPKDPESYRAWLHIGLGAILFALVYLIASW